MPGMKSIPLPRIPDIMEQLPAKYRAIVAVGVTTGCRITEILSLRRFDLLTREGNMKKEIAFLKLKTKKKTVVHRKLSIPSKYRPYIVKHLQDEEQHGYDRPDALIFRGKAGKPLSRLTVWTVFRKILGEGYGTHWMRKTFAQELFRYYNKQNPGDPMRSLELTRRALGHARLDTTVQYLGINEKLVEEAQNEIFK